MIKENGYVIWPIYFDASINRSMGRRVPINLAVKNPTAEMLVEAVKKLGWKAEIESGAYPAFWWKKTGKLVVKGFPQGMKKSEVIRRITVSLKSITRK